MTVDPGLRANTGPKEPEPEADGIEIPGRDRIECVSPGAPFQSHRGEWEGQEAEKRRGHQPTPYDEGCRQDRQPPEMDDCAEQEGVVVAEDQPELRLSERGPEGFSGGKGRLVPEAAGKEAKVAVGMPVMVDREAVHPRQRPSRHVQTTAKIEFLAAMEVPVGEVTDLLDRFAPVEAAAIEPAHRPRLPVRLGPPLARLELDVAGLLLTDQPADPPRAWDCARAVRGRS